MMRTALLPSLLALTAAAVADERAPAAYDGKYAKDPAIASALARADDLRREALENAAAKLGLTPAASPPIVIAFADARPANPEKLSKLDGFLFFRTETDDDGTVRISLHLEPVAAGGADVAEEIRHEIVHALMRQRAKSREGHANLPKWLREGLAVHAAGQTAERTRWVVHSGAEADGLEKAFPGLEEGEHSLDRYAEDGLAVQYIAERKGDKALHDLTRRLVEGEDAHAAVEAVTGMKWADFRDAARKHALAAARKAQRPEWASYVKIREDDKARRYDDVIAAAAAFERSHAKSPVLADVLYFRGKAERLSEKFGAAAKTLRRALGLDRRTAHFLDETWYQLAQAQLGAKDHAEAAVTFATLLRDHPGLPYEDKVLVRLAESALRAGHRDAAREHLDLFDRSFPKSQSGKDAAALRKELEER